MTVYGYARVSSETQAEHGQGLPIQRDKIHAYAFSKSLDVDSVFTDAAESGATPLQDRPAGRTMLSVLKKGDHVIMASLDRAWRSLIDAEGTLSRWQEQGITPHILNLPVDLSTPLGRLFFQLLAIFAQFERTVIAERIKSGVRAAIVRRGGQWGPACAYGWKRPKVSGDPLIPVEEEQETIRHARALQQAGVGRLEISRRLNQEGLADRRGNPWTESSVRRCLLRRDPRPRGS